MTVLPETPSVDQLLVQDTIKLLPPPLMLSPAETVDTKQLPMEDKEANMLEEPPMDTPPPPMKDMAMEVMFNQAMANQAMVNQAMVKQQPMVVNTKLEAATFMLTHNNINLIL